MNVAPWIWWLVVFAVVLDFYVIWIWRRYRGLRQLQIEIEGDNPASRWELLLMAMMPEEQDQPENEEIDAEEDEEQDSLPSTESPPNEEIEDTQTTAWFKAFMLILGFGLVALSLWIQKDGLEGAWLWGKWVMLLAGLAIFILGQRIKADKALPQWVIRIWNPILKGLGVQSHQILFLVLCPFLVFFASVWAGMGMLMNNALLAILAWIASIALAIAGGWQSISRGKISPRTLYTAGLLTLGAFIIRFANVSNIPIVLSGDEASAGLNAVQFIDGILNNIFRVGWNSFPTFYFYIQSIPISILGQTTLAIRILSVVVGALTVGAVYLLIKEMFNEYAALLSALFLATLHYHNHFSRIGLNNIWDGFLFVVILGLLWYGWEKENRAAFLFAGFFLGLGQYFYVSGRTLFVFVPAWILLVGIFNWKKFKRNFASFLLLELVAIVTFYPLARYFIEYPNEFLAPMRRVSILGPWMQSEVQITGTGPVRIILQHIGKSFMGYTHIPLQFWYKPFEPILRFVPATLFFLGLSSLVINIRQTRMVMLGMWLVTIGVMGGLSESTPAAQRYVAVAPVLAIVVGYGLSLIVEELSKSWKEHRRLFSLLAVVIMLVLGADEIRFYFNDYTPDSDFGGVNSRVAQKMADYLEYKSDEFQVFFYGPPRMGYRSISSIPFLAPHIEGIDVYEPWGSGDNRRPTSDHLIFVFLPEHEDQIKPVQSEYPGGTLIEEIFRENELLYYLYELSPDS